MADNFKGDWAERKERFERWWRAENDDRPVLNIQAPLRKGTTDPGNDRWVSSSSGENVVEQTTEKDEMDYTSYWTDIHTVLNRFKGIFNATYYTAETYPRLFPNLGVASLAAFLGGCPVFAKDTIWYKAVFTDVEKVDLEFDRKNPWLEWSLSFVRRAMALSDRAYLVGIPDIVENLDVLGCLFESGQVMLDIVDHPEHIHRLLRKVQEAWFKVYELHRSLTTDAEGYSNFGPFQLLGKGRVAKLQCDMSAMISTDMFEEFVLPYLAEQVAFLDRSLYHLDGVDALRHLDLVLSLERLTALQWTPGSGKPDGGDECWDFIYRKALDRGKCIYALVAPPNVEGFIRRFGSRGVYILTQAEDAEAAEALVKSVERNTRVG